MDFKIGDRVSFLNDKGGGVIVSVKDKNTVIVAEDDGFSTPFLIKHLVKVNGPTKEKLTEVQLPSNAKEIKQIAILFVPKDNTQLLNCDFDLLLVNNSGVNFYFELYYFEGPKVLQFSSAQLADGMTHLIRTLKRDEIELFTKLRFQCIVVR
jgi:hypothetical protein